MDSSCYGVELRLPLTAGRSAYFRFSWMCRFRWLLNEIDLLQENEPLENSVRTQNAEELFRLRHLRGQNAAPGPSRLTCRI